MKPTNPISYEKQHREQTTTSIGFRQHYFVCRRGRELKWSNLPVSNENWAARSFGETNVPNTESDLCRCFWTWNRSSKFHWMCPSMVKFHRLQNCSVCVSKMHNMHLTPWNQNKKITVTKDADANRVSKKAKTLKE